MHFNSAVVIATTALSALVSSNTLSMDSEQAVLNSDLSSLLESFSTQYNDASDASDLMASALSYISSELPQGQDINQKDLESLISKYAPQFAPMMVDYIFSSGKHDFETANLGSSYLSDAFSSLHYFSKNGASSLSDIIVNALNKEAPSYTLDSDIGSATGSTEDDNSELTGLHELSSSDSFTTSDGSTTRVTSIAISAAAAAVGVATVLF
ncbi:hypothetical protein EV175_006579 [Coemansia sp. RSA 1933]|nr:hypothetical protein EV175_006579 [Coemansia sp. RSA 1933]